MTFTLSCSSDSRAIKKSLKQSVTLSEKQKYRFESYTITETILDVNVKDSISEINTSIYVENKMLKLDSAELQGYQYQKKDCLYKKNQSPYYMRSLYDNLIDDWQDMIDDTEIKISERLLLIDSMKSKIKTYNKCLLDNDGPIIMYKITHNYYINGAEKQDIVMLNSKYELIKK